VQAVLYVHCVNTHLFFAMLKKNKPFKYITSSIPWVFGFITFSNVYAEVKPEMTVLTLYQAAQSYDASFKSAKLVLQANQEKIIQAKALSSPTANALVNANVNYANLINTPITTHSYGGASVVLAANYPIWRPSLKQVVNQAEVGVLISKATLANAEQELMLRVAQAYFDVLLAHSTLVTIAAQKVAITQQLAQAKREFEVGTKTILDTNESQSRYDALLAQEVVATGEVLAKEDALSLLTGIKAPVLSQINQVIPINLPVPSDKSVWATRAEQANIAVQVAQLTAELAKSEIKRNQLNKKMTVDLNSSLSFNRGIRSMAANANSSVVLATIGIQANYPVYSAGSLDSKDRETVLNYDKALSDLEAVRRNVSQAARQTYLGFTYGIAQIKALESSLKSSKTLLASTKLGYSVGVRINLDVLNAQQLIAVNQTQLAKVRYDTLMLGLRLKALTAQLTVEDLTTLATQLK
jgi:outer membrane protein